MDLIGKFVMGGLALFVAWTIVRALRSGSLYSEGMAFTLEKNPFVFATALAVHLGIVAFCAAMAAGYTLQQI